MRYEQTERLIRAARYLAARRMGVTLDELADAFEVDRRTAERLRDAIGALYDLHHASTDEDGRKRWTVTGLDELDLKPTAEERAELDRAAEQLRKAGAPARAALLEALAEKLAAVTPAKAARRLAPDLEALAAGEAVAAGPRPDPGDALIADLRHALKAGTAISFRYGAPRKRRRVAPFGLIFGARYYLVGADLRAGRSELGPGEPVLWRLDRIAALDIEPDAFERPDGFDLQAWADEAFNVYRSGAADRVELRFSPAAAPDARRWRFHPTQALAEEPDGALRVTFTARWGDDLVHHLMTWGAEVEVVGPGRLRAALVEALRVALGAHTTPGT